MRNYLRTWRLLQHGRSVFPQLSGNSHIIFCILAIGDGKRSWYRLLKMKILKGEYSAMSRVSCFVLVRHWDYLKEIYHIAYLSATLLHQELQEAISKLNSYFGSDKTQGNVALNQDDVGEIGLGMWLPLRFKCQECRAPTELLIGLLFFVRWMHGHTLLFHRFTRSLGLWNLISGIITCYDLVFNDTTNVLLCCSF